MEPDGSEKTSTPQISQSPSGIFANRYEIESLLGSGGMGKVYKAYDLVLQRHVALKFVRTDEPELERRLLREAQAQAKVEHECVCKIFDFGQAEGRLFIAMQYIEGESFHEAQKKLTLEQKVLVMKRAAEGIHAAHKIGLIHRDLKPSNIMLERSELKPVIFDFGLVRDTTKPDQSRTGVIHGTPYYMSPEQARGEVHKLDRRSDVYSLGATFYELLTHRPPVEGSGVDIFLKLMEEDPERLRKLDPSIPVDVETIIMKCLEKEPDRRYESAREFAEDIQRYLEGEPIRARPTTLTYRLRKRIRKNKFTVGIGTSALLLVIVLLGMWTRARWEASERAQLAQQLGEKVMQVESILRQIYTLPRHDVRKEKAAVQKEMESLTGRILKDMGKIGKGPGDYALGRTYFLLQDYDKAREHLERAWNEGYRTPDVSNLLGRVLGELYQQELAAAERIENNRAREIRISEIQKTYRDPAVAYLNTGRNNQVEAPEYLDALIAFYRGDHKHALNQATKVLSKSPWLYEAAILQGAIHKRDGSLAYRNGDMEGAIAASNRAIQAFDAAILIGESDVRGYEGLCSAWLGMLGIELHSRERSVGNYRAKVLESCGNALQVDPDSVETNVLLSGAHRFWGRYEMYHGQDPSRSFQQALEAARRVLRSEPSSAEAYEIMANVYWHQGNRAWMEGKDPVNNYQAAIESAERSIAIHPNLFDSYNTLGLVYLDMGNWQINSGRDPGLPLDKSIKAFGKAMDIDSSAAVAVLNIGLAYLTQGEYLVSIGKDPTAHLDRAIGALKKSIRMDANQFLAHRFLGYTYRVLAGYEWERGMNPSASLDQALSVIHQAVELNKNDLLSYSEIAGANLIRAEYEIEHGSSVAVALDALRNAVEKALAIDPAHAYSYFFKGQGELLQARWCMKNRENPEKFFQQAKATFEKGIELQPVEGTYYSALASVFRWRSEWKLTTRKDPFQDLSQGLAALDKALERNSSLSDAYITKGILLVFRARIGNEMEQRRRDAIAAKDAFQKALTINNNLRSRCAAYLEEAENLITSR